MWKDFFSFTRKERQGIFILLALVGGICIGKFFFSKEKQITEKNDKLIEQISESKKNETMPESGATGNSARNQSTYKLKPFDPNSADSSTFVSLGLKPYIAKNIIKYRNKGGKFKNSDDFSKIYGLSNNDFEKLKPYIQISSDKHTTPTKSSALNDTVKREILPQKESSQVTPKQEKIALGTILDINNSDTAELKKIPFIGSSFAKRIAKYREILGGFQYIEQIKEIYGVDNDFFLKISPYLTVSENAVLKKISVNQSSLDRLKTHPYINFYQAKVIIELRKKKGKINDLSELSLFEEFTEKDFERLKPYLSFE